jgi:hypothetical protein
MDLDYDRVPQMNRDSEKVLGRLLRFSLLDLEPSADQGCHAWYGVQWLAKSAEHTLFEKSAPLLGLAPANSLTKLGQAHTGV